jgi:primosomal protein N' (replication factor Y)
MTQYFIIDIIPLIRLPANAPDSFSYFYNSKIQSGSIVLIEFKKKKIFGYVLKSEPIEKKRKFLKEVQIDLKPVLKIVNNNPLIFPYQIKLAFWLKNFYNLSLSTSLSLFFPTKKLLTYSKQKNNIKKEVNKKILIIVPQKSYLEFLKKKYPFANLISFEKKDFYIILEKIIGNNNDYFIGTKNSIFLPWQNLEKIIIYEEGSIFYKDFFKPPYFNYRKIFLKFAEINKIKYEIQGDLPSFDSITRAYTDSIYPNNNRINYPNEKPNNESFGHNLGNSLGPHSGNKNIFGYNSGNLKNLERINEKEFENKIKEFKKTIIFVPEKTFGKKITCEFCFQSLTCSKCGKFLLLEENFLYCSYCFKKQNLPQICPFCQKKYNFFVARKGVKAIFKFLLNLKRNVYFLEKENNKIIKEFNKKEQIDLVGSLLLLNPLLENCEAFFFYNFDEFYFLNNYFLKEKFIRILDFFKNKSLKIFLISNIVNPEIENKIKNGEIIKDLIEERKINNLPPFKRLVILKEGSQDLKKIQKKLFFIKEKIKKDNPDIEIFGPIFAPKFKIKNRFFLEIVLKIENNLNFNLKKILQNIDIEDIDTDALIY